MACVTLKRSLDFDPLHSPSRPIKRRRCVPMGCSPEKRSGGPGPEAAMAGSPAKQSEFKESALTPEQIANNLRDEMKRLKKRREFRGGPELQRPELQRPDLQRPASPGSAPSSPEPMEPAGSSMEAAGVVTPGKNSEKPIFTLKQMSMIAERMCTERVEQVRAEYDQILQQKLSEQYDAFVKFIDHQIQKRFTESMAPSYLS